MDPSPRVVCDREWSFNERTSFLKFSPFPLSLKLPNSKALTQLDRQVEKTPDSMSLFSQG